MTIKLPSQSLSYVWQPEHYNSTVAEIGRLSGSRIIIDLSNSSLLQAPDNLHHIEHCEIKISPEQLVSHDLLELLADYPLHSLWVEYFSDLAPYDTEILINRISNDINIDCNIISGDVQFIQRCFEQRYPIGALAIKGSEASGFVGLETTLSLLSHTEKLTQQYDSQPPIHIWGGIGTPEGAVACLASGVDSVIFESIHWLTDRIIDQDHPLFEKISRLRLDHTTTISVHPSLRFRAFDKGNSLGVKDLKKAVNSQTSHSGKALSGHDIYLLVNDKAVSPLLSNLNSTELTGLGVEAFFCDQFIKRYGHDTQSALEKFSREIQHLYAQSSQAIDKMLSGPLVAEIGTQYPFIQGGMACISDRVDFALTVAENGGLPTIALGIKSKKQLEHEFKDLTMRMKGYSYAINIITLPENPRRVEQLEWLKKTKPPFVVISAGEPANGAELLEQGIEVIYVTSDPDLLKLAWQSGIRYVVCEGHEGGGHVGNHSTLSLAQAALQIKKSTRKEPRKYLILAGGLFNRNSLFRASILGGDGIQMGTAYLATQEIVGSGCLTGLYQHSIVGSSFGTTTLTGESIGLKVRALISPKTQKIQTLEKQFQTGSLDEADIRQQLEKISAGSLYIGARGKDPSNHKQLPEEYCFEEGQFMSGVVAGLIDDVTTVASLHRKLAEKSFEAVLQPTPQKKVHVRTQTGSEKPEKERIAITGMALTNALGNNPEEVWQACLEMKSGITEIPIERWDHSNFYLPGEVTAGKTYCHVGAFLNLDISRKELGIPPHDFRTMCESTKLTLWLAHTVIADSSILSSDIDRHRIGVLISQNAGEVGSTLADLAIGIESYRIASDIKKTLNLSDMQAEQLETIIQSERIAVDDTTLLGRLNCAAGGFICNKYGFTGPSYAVTAACATSLVALYSSIQMIQNGVLDAAVIGGGEELITPASYLEFSALGALAGKGYSNQDPSAYSRPFDQDRSGMVLGEGGAMIVIERESVAKKRGAHIYAYITGVGASNNHLGMVESVAETQEIAIRASFEACNYGPDEVDMIECHATATQLGDIEELKALRNIYPEKSGVTLSSFKSQIGHTLGASGLISLIHGICGMRASILPPTLNYDQPDPAANLEQAGFHLCKEPEPWITPGNRPKRFQVNAFGFGGANYVIQLEDAHWLKDSANDRTGQLPLPASQKVVETSLDVGVAFLKTRVDDQLFRIGVIDETADTFSVQERVQPYHRDLAKLTDRQKRELNRHGIAIQPETIAPPLALVFAGQGTHYPQMGKELYERFPTVKYWMDAVSELADFDILKLLFQESGEHLRKTVWQQPALFILEYALYQQFHQFGLQPTALAGHSMGELTALCVAGCFDFTDGFKIINKRAQCMEKASKQAIDPGGMIAVNAPEDFLAEKIKANDNLYFTNFNSPRQIVVGGSTGAIEGFKDELDELDYWNIVLPVSMAFHSPIMRIIRDELGDYLADIDFKPPRLPVLSNTTCQPYPDDPDEIKKIIISHLESPVHWQKNVLSLVNDFGCRLFVEIGPQDTLCNLIQECVPDTHCINSCLAEDEVKTMQQAISSLYIQGSITPPSITQFSLLEDKKPNHTHLNRQVSKEDILTIIQREINAFTFNGVEKYLKPVLLDIIRQEADPRFNTEQLNSYLADSFRLSPVPVATTGDKAPPTSEEEKVLEHIIGIIMEATGYERDEIDPEMDIKQDLAIKSSRLPIIIDSAEKAFNITVRLEDFMDVRTVGDLGLRIYELSQSSDSQPSTSAPAIKIPAITEKVPLSSPNVTARQPVQRVLLKKTAIQEVDTQLLSLHPEDDIIVFSLQESGNDIDKHLNDFFKEQFGIIPVVETITAGHSNGNGINLCDLQEVELFTQQRMRNHPPAGIILVTDLSADSRFKQAHISSFLTGFFVVLKELLGSEKRSFGLHISLGANESDTESILTEALLGLFLTAQLEYHSILFRSLRLDNPLLPSQLLPTALNPAYPLVEMISEGGQLYSREAVAAPIDIDRQKELFRLNDSDVILISGGAKGVTSYLARSLAPFGPTLILIGRSVLEPILVDHDCSLDINDETEVITELLTKNWPELSGTDLEQRKKQLEDSLEIKRTLTEITQKGARADYFSCDITDSEQLGRIVRQVVDKYGAVSGIIHGAGILKDSFISLLEADDFKQVVDIKLQGGLNLAQAAMSDTLRFIIGLSSIAAVTGNVGQANYCCGNRAMARFFRFCAEQNHHIRTKIFWLPPIEGAGMADDEEIKEIIQLKMGKEIFVEAGEAAELVANELLMGPTGDQDILPARKLPEVDSARVGPLTKNGLWYTLDSLPMLDHVERLDNHSGFLQATRTLNHERDPWVTDHKPFTLLGHPIFSTIMALESFLECGRLLIPYLQVQGLRNIHLTRMIECPAGQNTEVILHGQTVEKKATQALCRINLRRASTTESVEKPDQSRPPFQGEVILGNQSVELGGQAIQTTISDGKEIKPLSGREVADQYSRRTDLTNRYRVLDSISDHRSDHIIGKMVYPKVTDFNTTVPSTFQYPHYLLEGLMQLAAFLAGMRDENEKRPIVPTSIREVLFTRKCREGEVLHLEGHLLSETIEGLIFDGTGIDGQGQVVMTMSGLGLQWLG